MIVSTDIGGTDPDDFQSMVHLLVYADVLDIEGLIASPYGAGRATDIHAVIDAYEKDYPNLRSYSKDYPAPAVLRSITRQGELQRAPYSGVREATEGSRWIVECARRQDARPLHVLVWGGLEDLAQALHDAPEILPKLRVYWIGGPNKKWAPDAYQYLVQQHPTLWIIESNSTYRGWFTGGNQSGEWGNKSFVARHVEGHGALGRLFVEHKADLKMGDTPSVAWLLHGDPSQPSRAGWGGRFVRAWKRPQLKLNRLPTFDDRIEIFGVLELAIPVTDVSAETQAFLVVENQRLRGYQTDDDTLTFRFCPKAAKRYRFKLESNAASIDGATGAITVDRPPAHLSKRADRQIPNWWTDSLAADMAEGDHHGAKSVSRWRADYLQDFAERMRRCRQPQSP